MENKTYKDMTAIDFFKQVKRMRGCNDCLECDASDPTKIGSNMSTCKLELGEFFSKEEKEIEEVIKIVYNWSKKHSVKTMADILLETFPDAKIKEEDGIPLICPTLVVKHLACLGGCKRCMEEFWNREAPKK